MAGVKISNLPAIVTPAVGDVFAVVQGGVTYKESITQLGTLLLLLSGGTMTGDLLLYTSSPTNSLSAASKGYVDSVATGLQVLTPCDVATTANLTVTYDNGVSGVGATLTNAGALAALNIDGVALSLNERVLVKNQTTQAQNGIYTVTVVGDGATAWVMTRATDYDQPVEIDKGDYVLVTSGTSNTNTSWVETALVNTIGTDAVVWTQFGADISSIIQNIQNNAYVYGADTGAANAYALTLSPAITAYTAGLGVIVSIANANTGASTLNVNALGVKNIKRNDGTDPGINDLIAGQQALFVYDGTNFVLMNPMSQYPWAAIGGTTQAANVNHAYISDNAGATTITLPATFGVGDKVQVEGLGAAGWILAANAGDTIQIGTSATSAGGSLTSAASTDNIEVVGIVANTTWRVTRTNSAGLTIA